LEPPARSGFGGGAGSGTIYLEWTPSWVGAIVAAALSFVLLAFGAALGLAVASPSSSWRDTSAVLTLLSGLWLVLTALASFGLGGYLAGRLRIPLRPHTRDEVEFRDGIHGLLVWAIAILIGALLTVAVSGAISAGRATDAKSSTSEPLFALELDQLFRSDRKPTDAGDPELRAQAARIISSGLGHRTMASEDRAYLVRLVETRTGLAATDADNRVTQIMNKSRDAVAKGKTQRCYCGFHGRRVAHARGSSRMACRSNGRPASRRRYCVGFLATLGSRSDVCDPIAAAAEEARPCAGLFCWLLGTTSHPVECRLARPLRH